MKIRLTVSLALLVLFLRASVAAPNVFAEEAATKKLLTAVLVNAVQAPVIDGKLDDAAWNRAQEITGFSQIAPGNLPSKFPTFVRFLYDSRNLYISFRCVQPKSTLKLTAAPDGELWNDDCIELFLTPDIKNAQLQSLFSADQHYHLIFNADGKKFDELGNGGAASWNGNWEVKTTIADDEWYAEVKIPFATVTHKEVAPWPFQSWSLQIGRSLARDGERATLFTPQGLYRNHDAFGFLVFVANPQDEETVRWNIDKGNFVMPRLKVLGEEIADLKESAEVKSKIAALAARVPELTAAFVGMPPTTYTREVRAEYFQRISTLESDLRSLKEQMVVQRMKALDNKSGIALAPHPPVVDRLLVKPNFLPELDSIGKPIKVAVTAGQYQAASFVLWTIEPQQNVLVRATDLKSTAKTKSFSVPSKAIDVRWVKCWYQAGNNEIVRGPNILTPELLLKNPDLVTVDLKAEKNITFITPEMQERDYPGDSEELLPQKKIAGGTSTQVWLTIQVPDGTPAGTYQSTLDVVSGNKKLAALPLEVTVLDFTLAPSMLQHAWYARTMWGSSRFNQTPERGLAEAQNLARHGVTHLGLIEEPEELEKAVVIMKKGGLPAETLYIVGDHGEGYFPHTMNPVAAEAQARKWVAAAKAVGAKEVYLYLEDEARDEKLKIQRPVADAIHRAGAKTWVAGYADYFDLAGDYIDATAQAFGIVQPALVKKIHAIGSKIYSYANPQAGVERPEIYRRNYGLLLWQNDYDGAFNWQWYQTFGPTRTRSYNPWDDFIAPAWRQACMVYPTKDGVVDTIQWEGWREGVTDCRYMATLIREIERAKKEGRPSAGVLRAQEWVNALKSSGEKGLGDLDNVRAQMITHIQACRAAR